jgi:hypothetical protein
LLRERVSIDGDQVRAFLIEHTPEAGVVSVDLDIAQVAQLPDGRELLAGNAIPGRRSPSQVFPGDAHQQPLELVGRGRQVIQHVSEFAHDDALRKA